MTDQQWANESAGPIQCKRVNDAIGRLRWEAKTFVQVTGVIGGEERRSTLTQLVGGIMREDVLEEGRQVGERFGFTVTKENAKDIVAAVDEVIERASQRRPEKDERIPADEDAQRKAAMDKRNREAADRQARDDAMREQVRAKAPAGAHAVIVAELKEDTSDSQTDYFANQTVRAVAIGWRFSKREDFRALRSAAASFPETASLGPDAPKDIEHRDNYSMGGGNYLSDHGWDGTGSGWVVKSHDIGGNWWRVTEDAIPEAQPAQPSSVRADGFTVSPSSLGREGVIEIRFAEKPAPDILAGLKAAGFRWARGNRCWYGPETQLRAAGLAESEMAQA